MSTMISEQDLERMFAEVAESFAVPADGPGAILVAERAERGVEDAERFLREHRRRRGRGLAIAAGIVVLLVGGAGYGLSGSGDRSAKTPASSESHSATDAATAVAPQAVSDAARSSTGHATSGELGAGGAFAPAPAAVPSPPSLAGQGGNLAFSDSGAAKGAPAVQQRIVQTGTMGLAVPKGQVQTTVSALQGVARGQGGYLANTQDSETAANPTGSVTMRVPTAAFAGLLSAVSRLGTVTGQSTTGTDVTAQYVDLDARLTALRASKSTYLAILTTAKTVQETISVQQRVDDVQSQIEQLTGQQKVLADQSDLATLTVTVAEVKPPPARKPVQPAAPKPRGPWSEAVHTAGHSVLVVVRGLIAASGVIGLLLAALLVGLVGQRLFRVSRRRRAFGHSNG